MGLIIASIIIDSVLTLVYFDRSPGLAMFMALFVGLAIVGLICIATGAKKVGAIMAGIGSALFVPIGLIGVFGARQVLKQIAQENSLSQP
jgi:hypothetical protein